MAQPLDSADLLTDTYPMATSSSTSPRPVPTVDKKKTLGISAAALLLGGAAWAISQQIVKKTNPARKDSAAGETTPAGVELPKDIDVAGKVTDDMSFEQAFTAARNEVGMGGVFGWHGHWYNTFEKDEWSSLSLEQRQDYTEMITGEKLPVQIHQEPIADNESIPVQQSTEPTAIEGTLNGQRVIGLDYDHDGVIDVLVMEGDDGTIYKVADATGDDGLDTIYRYDSQDGELTAVARLEQSIVLSNDQFSQALEESMSREVVDSILEPDVSLPSVPEVADAGMVNEDDADDDAHHLTASHDQADDTYINDGDVQDMDE